MWKGHEVIGRRCIFLDGVGELQAAWSTDRPASLSPAKRLAFELFLSLIRLQGKLTIDPSLTVTRLLSTNFKSHRENSVACYATPSGILPYQPSIYKDELSRIMPVRCFSTCNLPPPLYVLLIEGRGHQRCQTLKSLRVAISDFLCVKVNTVSNFTLYIRNIGPKSGIPAIVPPLQVALSPDSNLLTTEAAAALPSLRRLSQYSVNKLHSLRPLTVSHMHALDIEARTARRNYSILSVGLPNRDIRSCLLDNLPSNTSRGFPSPPHLFAMASTFDSCQDSTISA